MKGAIKYLLQKSIPQTYLFNMRYQKIHPAKDERGIALDHKFVNSGLAGEGAILFAGFPKSGNTWVRFMIYNYYNILRNKSIKTLTYKELNSIQSKILEDESSWGKIDLEGFPNFYRTHNYGGVAFQRFSKVIYIYRNPLDTLISYYHWCKDRTVPMGIYPEDIRKYALNDIDYFVMRELPSWVNHYRSSVKMAQLVLSYEDLKVRPIENLTNIIRLIDDEVDKDAITRSVEISSISSIRIMEQESQNIAGMGNSTFTGKFTRSGEVNQYSTVLSAKTKAAVESILRIYEIPIDVEL